MFCSDFQHIALIIHSYLRWLILPLMAVLCVLLFAAYKRCRKEQPNPNEKQDIKLLKRLHTVLVSLVDLSVLLGIIIYYGYYTKNKDFGIMSHPEIRKRLLEHGPLMIVVLVLLHICSGLLKKQRDEDRKRLKKAFYFYLIALILILAAVPSWILRSF